MASKKNHNKKKDKISKKKTKQGQGIFTKFGNRGGGLNGSTPAKKYKKPYKGQGK